MLETRRGTADGFTIQNYEKGREYSISDFLASRFVLLGVAKILASDTPNTNV